MRSQALHNPDSKFPVNLNYIHHPQVLCPYCNQWHVRWNHFSQSGHNQTKRGADGGGSKKTKLLQISFIKYTLYTEEQLKQTSNEKENSKLSTLRKQSEQSNIRAAAGNGRVGRQPNKVCTSIWETLRKKEVHSMKTSADKKLFGNCQPGQRIVLTGSYR